MVRVALITAPGEEWDVTEVELDEQLAADEILVDVTAAGLCHSDEHLRLGALPSRFPFVGGHEGAGRVVAVGTDVESVAPGDRVTFCFRPACGQCDACLGGRSHLCEHSADLRSERVLRHFHRGGERLAATNLIGSFSSRIVVPAYSVVRVDADVSEAAAAILGCAVMTGYGAVVRSARVTADDTVLLIGAGGVGIAVIQTARAIGATVIAVDPSEDKRTLAAEFGAALTAATVEEVSTQVGEAGRVGVPTVAIVAAGVPGLAETAARALAPGGRVVLAALGDPSKLVFSLPVNEMVVRNLTVGGAILGGAQVREDVPRLLELVREGRFDLEGMVTGSYPLAEINAGYEDLRRAARTIRNVVTF